MHVTGKWRNTVRIMLADKERGARPLSHAVAACYAPEVHPVLRASGVKLKHPFETAPSCRCDPQRPAIEIALDPALPEQ